MEVTHLWPASCCMDGMAKKLLRECEAAEDKQTVKDKSYMHTNSCLCLHVSFTDRPMMRHSSRQPNTWPRTIIFPRYRSRGKWASTRPRNVRLPSSFWSLPSLFTDSAPICRMTYSTNFISSIKQLSNWFRHVNGSSYFYLLLPFGIKINRYWWILQFIFSPHLEMF